MIFRPETTSNSLRKYPGAEQTHTYVNSQSPDKFINVEKGYFHVLNKAIYYVYVVSTQVWVWSAPGRLLSPTVGTCFRSTFYSELKA